MHQLLLLFCLQRISTQAGHVQPNVSLPMNRNTLQNLPLPVLSEILSYVDPAVLPNVAATCSRLYLAATTLLYRSIQIVPHPHDLGNKCCRRAGQNKNLEGAYDELLNNKSKNPVYKGCRIFHLPQIEALAATLEKNPLLAEKIYYFDFHFGYSDDRVKLCQSNMHLIMQTYALNIRRYRMMYNNVEVDALTLHADGPFINASHVEVTDLGELETMHERRIDAISFHLDQSQIGSLDLFSSNLDYLYQIPALEFATVHGFGLDVVRALHCGPVKLETSLLTLEHRHEAEHEEYESRGAAGFESESHRLDFGVLEEKFLLTRLTSLHLRVSCREHNDDFIDDGCHCFVGFLADWQRYLSANSGLPNLRELELSVPPAREWARPHDLLNAIVTPSSDFIKTLTGLKSLTFGLCMQTYKMYEQTGMSPARLNRVNTRLIEAFFLSLGGVMQTLEHMELPDFLMAFFFYKPQFMELLLHTCQCSGCSMVLKELDVDLLGNEEDANGEVEGEGEVEEGDEELSIVDHDAEDDQNEYESNETEMIGNEMNENGPAGNESTESEIEYEIDDEIEDEIHDRLDDGLDDGLDDELVDVHEIEPEDFNLLALHNGAFYVMIGIILEKLLSERMVLTPLNRKTVLSECSIYGGPPNVLRKLQLLCGKRNLLDLDTLACTYILHQIRPVLQFLAKHFSNLSLVMVHGLYYEKKMGEFQNVFDCEEYPDVLYQRGHVVSAEKYGHYVFD